MDSFTQIALGATIGEAVFRKKLGGKATVVGGVCGLLPDLDFVIGIGDPWGSLVHHRAESHSLLVLPLVAFVTGALAWLWAKKSGGYLHWVHLCFWALITHPLLDTCTSYGTQLLAPITDARYSIDAASIIDPVYSLPLFVTVYLAVRKKRRDFARKFAAGALVATTLYLGYGWVQSQRAVSAAQEQLHAEGYEPTQLRALPTFFNNHLYRVAAIDESRELRIGFWSALAPRQIDFVELEPDTSPEVQSVLAHDRTELLQWFSTGLLHVARQDEETVRIVDQRFGLYVDPQASAFSWIATIDENDQVTSVQRGPRTRDDMNVGAELNALWRRLWTGR